MLEARKQQEAMDREETTPVSVVASDYKPPAVVSADLANKRIAEDIAYINTQKALLRNKFNKPLN